MTLSAQDNVKLLDQLKSGFHRTINWNKYQSKTLIQARNQYLDYLIAPSLQDFFFCHLKTMHTEQVTIDIFSRL